MIHCRITRLLGVSLLVWTGACDRSPPPPEATAPTEPSAAAAPAEAEPIQVPIAPRSESKLAGSASFRDGGNGVIVSIKVSNAPPGPKGAHIHENGDCSAPDAKSAGEHFNPGGHPHARPPDAPRHLGDLGNIEIAADGAGARDVVVEGANLKPGDPNSFLDRAVIIHEKADDGSQPSGNAGTRIGCGVISRK
jgi:superoxide dismutase, Cu-Zn family